jgi:hypothetical protein
MVPSLHTLSVEMWSRYAVHHAVHSCLEQSVKHLVQRDVGYSVEPTGNHRGQHCFQILEGFLESRGFQFPFPSLLLPAEFGKSLSKKNLFWVIFKGLPPRNQHDLFPFL